MTKDVFHHASRVKILPPYRFYCLTVSVVIAAVFVTRKGHVKNGIFAFDVVITLLKLIVTIFAYPTERSVCDISNSKCQICRIEPSKCSSDQ